MTETRYSEWIDGDEANFKRPVRLDVTDGYVGVTQRDKDRTWERVLLTPAQVRALIAFATRRRRATSRTDRPATDRDGVRDDR